MCSSTRGTMLLDAHCARRCSAGNGKRATQQAGPSRTDSEDFGPHSAYITAYAASPPGMVSALGFVASTPTSLTLQWRPPDETGRDDVFPRVGGSSELSLCFQHPGANA